MPVERLAQPPLVDPPNRCNTKAYQTKRRMTRYDVICPSAPWENHTTDEDRAWDLCFSLSEEYGYAEVRCNGVVIGEYGNPATFLDWR